MLFVISFTAALVCLSLGVVLALFSTTLLRKRQGGLAPYHAMVIGTLLALAFYFFPMAHAGLGFSRTPGDLLSAGIAALYNAIRLFAIDGDYFEAIALAEEAGVGALLLPYRVLGAVLHLLAPLLTFGFILSFVRNFSSLLRYRLSVAREVHIFSELNERSLALAGSILAEERRRHPILSRAMIVFTDVVTKQEEAHYELASEAERMGAILFCKDMESIRFRLPLSRRRFNFYLIEENESEKLRHAAAVMRDYDKRGVMLYVFSSSTESELMLSTRNLRMLKVVRVNDIQSLVYHNLDLYGMRLFRNARRYNENEISAVIVGLGQYGREMLKALTWYAQVPGFRLKIHVFEEDGDAEERLRRACPELLTRSGVREEGESYYEITIHPKTNAAGAGFLDELSAIGRVTYVFVSLGEDEKNIDTALAIRAHLERCEPAFHPDVETVVYDSSVATALGVTWHEPPSGTDEPDGVRIKKKACRIHMIGDLASFYSVETVLDSALVEAGLRVHLRYSAGDPSLVRALDRAEQYAGEKERALGRAERRRMKKEERALRRDTAGTLAALEREYGSSFWMQEYNYRSSIAKALAERLRRKFLREGYITLPGIDKPWGERTEEEKLAIGSFEHIRWNAYMRTEGYRRGERSDLGKLHNLLRPLDELSDDDIRKDA